MTEVPTKRQRSAGGVAYRQATAGVEVTIIRPAGTDRWQLPKGLVGKNEAPEDAALREVREETGLTTEMVAPLETIEYWYYASTRRGRARFHKSVYFYLLRYLSGDAADHDAEVDEARWVGLDEALELLAFGNEKNVVRRARDTLNKNS